MSKTDEICEHCRQKVEAVFNPTTGTRDRLLINGRREFGDCCLVADEIVFNGDSRMVFVPTIVRERKQYCREYFVICRKLVISGGREGKDNLNPCGPEDPGKMYDGNNVITWADRLEALPDASDIAPPKAGKGDSHDRDTWSDKGQGNVGANGGNGLPGAEGKQGTAGFSPTPSVTVLALEVDIAAGSHLNIDFDGQNGGRGGKGQEAGDGGDGMGGRGGHTETHWPGDDECDRQPGDGGDGGNGGPGGRGGRGGEGGRAGNIVIVSTPANITTSGVFFGGHLHYINDGGQGGKGGKGGKSGVGGKGGKQGKPKTEMCEEPDPGVAGEPTTSLGAVDAADGGVGPSGGGGNLAFEDVESGSCADIIPFAPMSVASVTPSSGAQGATVRVTIAGVGFNPTAAGFGVEVAGFGVSAAIVASPPAPPHTSTLTTWDFTISGVAPKTARDVTVKNSPVNKADLTDGFTVT